MNWQERAEAAEAELLAVREDNHSMMLEIDGLRKELAKLREQEPVAYVKYKATGGNVGLSWLAVPTGAIYPREGEPLYASHVPDQREGKLAVAAPAVPERLMYALKDLKARAYKQLDHGKGRSVYIDSNTAIDIADAMLQSAQQSDKEV